MADSHAINQAVGAHGMWKNRLKEAIASGSAEIPVDTIGADDQCVFGKWLYGPHLSVADKATEYYKAVLTLHSQFHKTAARVAELALAGKKQEADTLLTGEFAEASVSLTSAMMEWKSQS